MGVEIIQNKRIQLIFRPHKIDIRDEQKGVSIVAKLIVPCRLFFSNKMYFTVVVGVEIETEHKTMKNRDNHYVDL